MKTIERIGSVFLLLAAMLWMTACSDMTDGKTFYERAMEKIPLPKGCSEWKYLPNDYDSDGKIEVFAFGGEEDGDWKYLEAYYIEPNGKVTQVLCDSHLRGMPRGEKKDFSDCYLTIGKQKYANFAVGDVEGSCVYTMVFGVYNKRPIVDYMSGSAYEVTEEGYVVCPDISMEYVYAVRNGKFVLVKETVIPI